MCFFSSSENNYREENLFAEKINLKELGIKINANKLIYILD